ncbi:helix-turn-helix domain-containing protein [Enemella evansiae]|nr:helix-turn-helix domain-containing protein [Enemella evansiae]
MEGRTTGGVRYGTGASVPIAADRGWGLGGQGVYSVGREAPLTPETPATHSTQSGRACPSTIERVIVMGERDRLLYSVNEAMELLNLGRSVIYELIRSGQLRTVKVGRRRLVPAKALDDYVNGLADAA